MTYERVLDLAVPFLDEYPKSKLMELVSEYPEFRNDFENQITPEYEAAIKKKGIFFVINNDSWKRVRAGWNKRPRRLRLGYVGKEELPLLSLDI